MAATKSVTVY